MFANMLVSKLSVAGSELVRVPEWTSRYTSFLVWYENTGSKWFDKAQASFSHNPLNESVLVELETHLCRILDECIEDGDSDRLLDWLYLAPEHLYRLLDTRKCFAEIAYERREPIGNQSSYSIEFDMAPQMGCLSC